MKRVFLLCIVISGFYGLKGQTFAVIGDYGLDGQNEADVANLVKGWKPDFVITTGDNNYESGDSATIDQNIGKYYHEFIFPYKGAYGAGDTHTTNRFFPSLGNHDYYTAGGQPYFNYFTLPDNERYYEVVWGDIHLFALNSNSQEPDGNTNNSAQADWLRKAAAASVSKWKLVYFHHAPFSSALHGNSPWMQWDFRQMGITAVIASHDHVYERLLADGIPYFVNGLGGKTIYNFNLPLPESKFRYNGDFGAMRVEANGDSLVFQFIDRAGAVIDSYVVNKGDSVSGLNFFQSMQAEKIQLKIYNVMGQVVAEAVPGIYKPGTYEVACNSGLPAGVYIYCWAINGKRMFRKVLLVQ